MANQLRDLQDALAATLEVSTEVEPAEQEDPSGRREKDGLGDAAGRGWPVEAADIVVLDPSRLVVVSTLGDPDLARRVAAAGHPVLAAAGPTATENVGLEKLVRNVLANRAFRVLVLCGPETGGSAPTGHYAGDALLALHDRGVDPATMRVVGARGRRPFVRNLSVGEVEAFRRQVILVDRRGEERLWGIAAALDEAAALGEAAALSDECASVSSAESRASSSSPEELVELVDAAPLPAYRPDPAGYVLIFVDRGRGGLLAEHYTPDDRRTLVVTGREGRTVARALIARGLVGTVDHAAYLGRELERAEHALRTGVPYVQDARVAVASDPFDAVP